MSTTSEIGILRAARIATATDRTDSASHRSNRLPGLCKTLFFPGLLLWLAGVTASAQQEAGGPGTDTPAADTPAAVTEQPVRYTVEVIIFTYADTSSAGNEVFTPPAPLPDSPFDDAATGGLEGPVFDDRTRSPQPEAEGAAESGPLREIPARARIELTRLEPEAFRMQETWRKLRQLDAYRPILHAAWTQTTHEKSVSPALPLRALSDPPLGLDGSISLYRSRFLHLDVELTLDASEYAGEDRRQATDRLVNPASADGASDEARGLALPPVRYRIAEDRIMRDGDVRYFDHPRFGMLARVMRVEPESDDGPVL